MVNGYCLGIDPKQLKDIQESDWWIYRIKWEKSTEYKETGNENMCWAIWLVSVFSEPNYMVREHLLQTNHVPSKWMQVEIKSLYQMPGRQIMARHSILDWQDNSEMPLFDLVMNVIGLPIVLHIDECQPWVSQMRHTQFRWFVLICRLPIRSGSDTIMHDALWCI